MNNTTQQYQQSQTNIKKYCQQSQTCQNMSKIFKLIKNGPTCSTYKHS